MPTPSQGEAEATKPQPSCHPDPQGHSLRAALKPLGAAKNRPQLLTFQPATIPRLGVAAHFPLWSLRASQLQKAHRFLEDIFPKMEPRSPHLQECH